MAPLYDDVDNFKIWRYMRFNPFLRKITELMRIEIEKMDMWIIIVFIKSIPSLFEYFGNLACFAQGLEMPVDSCTTDLWVETLESFKHFLGCFMLLMEKVFYFCFVIWSFHWEIVVYYR